MEKRNPLKIYESDNHSIVNLSDGKIPPQALDLEERSEEHTSELQSHS